VPFKSRAQRAWMHIHHPKMAKRWDAHTPKGKLPDHVHDDVDAARQSADDGPMPSLWDIFGHMKDDGSGN
jgi:hypothetical protein